MSIKGTTLLYRKLLLDFRENYGKVAKEILETLSAKEC
ncbi:hypothetical protein D1AOALGA4SA_11508 [Olavius algarvensis Delta 1 endosymbiont]|nr:hypothetical protein D1AOALGA4SA_11508 [Olavius algarvensis Delta 1 endosymbiont]